jgi:hypothetical protein
MVGGEGRVDFPVISIIVNLRLNLNRLAAPGTDGGVMSRASRPVYFGDEAQQRMLGREAELFPLPVRSRFRVVLWVSLLVLGAGLAYVIVVLAGHVR